MGTNEFYYNGEKTITSKEAHALQNKTLLIVSDKARTITFLKAMIKKMEVK